ncbi:DUF1707 SHOCT-like domain-containing protein [Streptomyces hoynatensis]|uniref:DUF1707 and DUF2154 domain-containing protein n=1 Tax=Streptomyces hoynatensis TaxID=1141874 RepID=A0A3A9ZF39_9ACTN|nr:DUF1707 domain-containing protein [Streptomyces hoynatensis]RKN47001.1 DUF1707 and DUF2154 domain-containing protein [Streptomyces hoynatensis]
MTAENPPAVPLDKQPAPPVRASDADRDRIADILREALAQGRIDADEHSERVEAVYRAKTLGELEPLIGDLPEGQRRAAAPAPGAPEAVHAPQPAGRGHGLQVANAKNVVAVLSGASRQGRWRVGPKVNAVAVCGGVELDFTEAIFEYQQVVVNATAICGGIEIKVPENVSLRSAGSGIMGGFEVKEQESTQPDAPVVVVQGVAVWGGVDAKPVAGKRVRDLSDD